MPDATATIAALKDAMQRFVDERDWQQFHSPKNLSMGLAVEAAELMEHFLWMDNADSRQVQDDQAKLGEVAFEIADVMCYVLALCNTLQIDLSEAVAGKLIKNAEKYPAQKYRGKYRAE